MFDHSKLPTFVQSMVGGDGQPLRIELGDRIIDAHAGIDIATFDVTRQEIESLRHTVLTGYQREWPPPFPQIDRGVIYCGYPGKTREPVGPREIIFGRFGSAGIISSLSETSVSIQIERENLFRVLGEGVMSDGYDFGGISGGPLVAMVETAALRSWMPAGVVIQGPNPSHDASQSISGFEMIKARPIQFIKADGFLDSAKWEMNNLNFAR
jgi:hypothetical protein